MKRCGRPPKKDHPEENKEKIIQAAIALIEAHGADYITVRRVCAEANLATGTFYYHFRNKDDLLMHFVRETSFENIELKTPQSGIAERITELYLHLFRQYTKLGEKFMKNFYTADNQALHAYMGEVDGKFEPETIMSRCEQELTEAQKAGRIKNGTNIHQLSADICTIAKGCIFEWCLSGGKQDIGTAFGRILQGYLKSIH